MFIIELGGVCNVRLSVVGKYSSEITALSVNCTMDEALLVKMVWLFLPLLLSHVSAELFSVVVPETTVSGQLGGSVTLPCALSDNLDVRKLEVRWYRPSMYSSPALLYLNEKLDPSVTDITYQGRVSLPGPLEKGDVSLKLDDLRPSDLGMYMCHVHDR
uniref:Ig-like domain-containing protein n=1 Tax=Astyanax mexicanus TaxID=7994 RepID=A0A3B1KHZ8_ASTMX